MTDGVRHPAAARGVALLLLAWTLLLAVRVVVALLRGDWVVGMVGAAVVAGSAGMTAWAWLWPAPRVQVQSSGPGPCERDVVIPDGCDATRTHPANGIASGRATDRPSRMAPPAIGAGRLAPGTRDYGVCHWPRSVPKHWTS